MTAGSFPGEWESHRDQPGPDPADVARLIAARTGNLLMNPATYDQGNYNRWLDITYQTAQNEIHSGTAVVHVRHLLYGDPERPEEPTDRQITEATIGHYRPDLNVWVMYPEYQPGDLDQTRNLMEYFERMSKAREDKMMELRSSGQPFLDLRNQSTMEMRRKTGLLLHVTGLDENIVRQHPYLPGGLSHMRFDESTSAYMIIAPRFDQANLDDEIAIIQSVSTPLFEPLQQTQTLSVVYQGVLFTTAGHTTRGEHVVDIATQDTKNTNLWTPNLGVITPHDWAALQQVPQDFDMAKRMNPAFLADRCAVGVNIQDSYIPPNPGWQLPR